MIVSDPSLGLLVFLINFDSLEFNNLYASHFHRSSGFRGGVFLGNILMELLYAVLISLKDFSLDSLFEGGFWSGREWCKTL